MHHNFSAKEHLTDSTTLMRSESTGNGAIIISLAKTHDEEAIANDSLDELEALLQTLKIPVLARILQRRLKPTAHCLYGTGKVEELTALATELGAGLIVSDHPLSPSNVRNLEAMTKRMVTDRTGVILEIFSRHARSNQARTQVEIAKLEYLMPRLQGAWTHFQRQSGGGVMRGMGEKQIEVDRRRARDRMSKLSRQLEQFGREREVQRKARRSELKVALVGYTNSGKTTLMKQLTQSAVSGRDELFATLDTHIKTIDPRTRPRILISDTVGFIRNLPHSLVESFKSTLAEVTEADLLLEVVDVSHPKYRDQIETTDAVLTEIGAGDIPRLMIFNKADRLEEPGLRRIIQAGWPGSVVLSALHPKEVEGLRDRIAEYFKKNLVSLQLAIPVEDQQMQSLIHNTCLVLDADYSQNGHVLFQVQAAKSLLSKLSPFIVSAAIA